MILTHVWDRIGCRWVWRLITRAHWTALPRVAGLGLACGGGMVALPASPPVLEPVPRAVPVALGVPVPSPSILIFLPPERMPVDRIRPIEFMPVNDIAEPSTLALFGLASMFCVWIRQRKA